MTDGIEIVKLCKSYKNHLVVDQMTLHIPKGCFFALLGVNGAGKSTTLRMLSGLTQPASGDAFLHGRSIIKDPIGAKALLGVSPQETAVAPNLTVQENLELMAALKFRDPKICKEQVQCCMEQFSLQNVQRKRAKILSGGYQRRLSIAMALVTRPEILFLDEPTLGLDVISRRELWVLLKKLKGSTTVIMTTHYLEEAEALADRVGIMAKGKLCAEETIPELCLHANCAAFEDAFLFFVKGAEE